MFAVFSNKKIDEKKKRHRWYDEKNQAPHNKCVVQSAKQENWIAEAFVPEFLHALWGQNCQTDLMKQRIKNVGVVWEKE